MQTAELQKKLNQTWNARDLQAGFKRSAMTIHLWRRHKGLPAIVIPGDQRPAVRYVPREVLQWAKRNGIEWHGVAA